jgi:uncharacterized protein YdaU (DUF1376 family)
MDPAKFLSDTRVDVMTTLELGACFRLMCRQWIDGFIPDDQNVLARLCRLDASSMAEAWVTLSHFFPVVEPGKRANRFMWIEREKIIADLEKRSDEGTKAARKRWDDVRNKRDAIPSGSPMPDPMQDQTRPEQTRVDNTFPQTAFAVAQGALSDNSKNSKPTDAQIEQLYGLYPRKRGKLDAKKAIRKAVGVVMDGDPDHPAMPLDEALDHLVQRITLYAQCVQGCDFIPYPATWFNDGCFWDDERDWRKHQAEMKTNRNSHAPVPLPADYVSPSEQIRRERAAAVDR